MRAWILRQPGGPEAFELTDIPRPEPRPGQVLIEIRAFGLNRSEWFTRIGESPTVRLPRVLGIECVGTVVRAPGGELEEGQRVAAMMGGMGREFDGSYAEYTSVPAANVFPLETELPWDVVGALPEMLQTCHGSLHTGLGVEPGETLLIRGGTSSIGLTTLAMAKAAGLRVISTSRSDAKVDVLRKAGADEVVIDDGKLGRHDSPRPPWRGRPRTRAHRDHDAARLATVRQTRRCRLHDRHPRRRVGARVVSADGAHPYRRAADLLFGRRERHLERGPPALRVNGRARGPYDPHGPRVELRSTPARSPGDG